MSDVDGDVEVGGAEEALGEASSDGLAHAGQRHGLRNAGRDQNRRHGTGRRRGRRTRAFGRGRGREGLDIAFDDAAARTGALDLFDGDLLFGRDLLGQRRWNDTYIEQIVAITFPRSPWPRPGRRSCSRSSSTRESETRVALPRANQGARFAECSGLGSARRVGETLRALRARDRGTQLVLGQRLVRRRRAAHLLM